MDAIVQTVFYKSAGVYISFILICKMVECTCPFQVKARNVEINTCFQNLILLNIFKGFVFTEKNNS